MPFSQYCSRPSRQLSHSRQESTMQPTPTRSPGAKSSTAGPDAADPAHDLVPGNQRVILGAPFAAGGVNVRVAEAAEFDGDLDVVRLGCPPGERQRHEAAVPGRCAIRRPPAGRFQGAFRPGARRETGGQGAAVRVVLGSYCDATPALPDISTRARFPPGRPQPGWLPVATGSAGLLDHSEKEPG